MRLKIFKIRAERVPKKFIESSSFNCVLFAIKNYLGHQCWLGG